MTAISARRLVEIAWGDHPPSRRGSFLVFLDHGRRVFPSEACRVKAARGGGATVSLTVTKNQHKWLIAAMHFSTLTGGPEAANKGT
jgi:hypothetical protein